MKLLKLPLILLGLFAVNSHANTNSALTYSPAQVTEIIQCGELVAANMSWGNNRMIGRIGALIEHSPFAMDASYAQAEVVFRFFFDCQGNLFKLRYIKQ